jgi:FlaG/FlaF family flagellin (archaellin)
MSFEMTGLEYDVSRKQQSLVKNFGYNNTTGKINSQYAPIPYNFNFTLSLYVRNQEDGTQILEQILPFFTPDFTVTVDLIPSMDQKYDMPIILNSVSPEIDYEGDMLTTRTIIWTLDFTVKGYIFPPVNTSGKIIKQANTNILIDSQSRQAQQVYVDYANGIGVFTTGETVRVAKRGVTGFVTYFANNSTGTLVVEELNDLLKEDDILVGDYSNAIYTIDTVDLNPLKTVQVIVTPNPSTANGDGDYGYTTTIDEWPDTL